MSFENRAGSFSFGSIINVNGLVNISPTPQYDLGVTASAYQTLNYNEVQYTFVNWTPGGSANTTLLPTSAGNYFANYTGKPAVITFSINYGEEDHILLLWGDHPEANVTQYQIWRKVTPYGGPAGQPVLIATVNRGTTEFTDNQYYYTDNHLHKTIGYDVCPYFQPTDTYADANWKFVYGNTYPGGRNDGEEVASDLKSEPVDYRFESFPNPFNPSTQLQYQLKEDAYVRIVIFDMLGRTVAELVNSTQKAGTHNRLWNASEMGSGIYFATFIVIPVNEKPFAMTKKLILMK